MYNGTYLKSIVDSEYIKALENWDLEILSFNKLDNNLYEIEIYSPLPINDFLGV